MKGDYSMDSQYEVLNPWAEVDPIPLRGISPRPTDLTGKNIGLFVGHKMASRPILVEVEKRLKERITGLKFSQFLYHENIEVTESNENDKFREWVNGVDAVICAVGD
jgi:hypothetical protein